MLVSTAGALQVATCEHFFIRHNWPISAKNLQGNACSTKKSVCFFIFYSVLCVCLPFPGFVCAVVAAVAGVAVSDLIVLTAAATAAGTMVEIVGIVAVYLLPVVAIPLAPGATTVLTVLRITAVSVAFWPAAVTTRLRGIIHGLLLLAEGTGSVSAGMVLVDKLRLRKGHATEGLLDEDGGKLGLNQFPALQEGQGGLGVFRIMETDIGVLRCEGDLADQEGEMVAQENAEEELTFLRGFRKADHHIIGYRRRRRGFHGVLGGCRE